MKDKIPFNEFLEIEKKIEIKVGEILEAERVPKSDKMLKLAVSFGDEPKTVLTNIGSQFEPEELVGLKLPFITNLEPAKMMGITSEAMVVAHSDPDGKVHLPTVPLDAGMNLL